MKYFIALLGFIIPITFLILILIKDNKEEILKVLVKVFIVALIILTLYIFINM